MLVRLRVLVPHKHCLQSSTEPFGLLFRSDYHRYYELLSTLSKQVSTHLQNLQYERSAAHFSIIPLQFLMYMFFSKSLQVCLQTLVMIVLGTCWEVDLAHSSLPRAKCYGCRLSASSITWFWICLFIIICHGYYRTIDSQACFLFGTDKESNKALWTMCRTTYDV